MKSTTSITFELNDSYYKYGRYDALNHQFDTVYLQAGEDAKMSYLAGWASVKSTQSLDPKDLDII